MKKPWAGDGGRGEGQAEQRGRPTNARHEGPSFPTEEVGRAAAVAWKQGLTELSDAGGASASGKWKEGDDGSSVLRAGVSFWPRRPTDAARSRNVLGPGNAASGQDSGPSASR